MSEGLGLRAVPGQAGQHLTPRLTAPGDACGCQDWGRPQHQEGEARGTAQPTVSTASQVGRPCPGRQVPSLPRDGPWGCRLSPHQPSSPEQHLSLSCHRRVESGGRRALQPGLSLAPQGHISPILAGAIGALSSPPHSAHGDTSPSLQGPHVQKALTCLVTAGHDCCSYTGFHWFCKDVALPGGGRTARWPHASQPVVGESGGSGSRAIHLLHQQSEGAPGTTWHMVLHCPGTTVP